MGRGANNVGSSLLYGALPPPRSRPGIADRVVRLAIPLAPHAAFKPTFGRLGLEDYFADPEADNDGYCGGKVWQALGATPAAWTRFKSARPINDQQVSGLSLNRKSFERAARDQGTLTCEIGDVETDDDGAYRRRVYFGSEWSGCTLNADHFEAMTRVILAGGHNIHDTRFLSAPNVVICFDDDGTLVGFCTLRRDDR